MSLQDLIKSGDVSWDNEEFFCQWQSQILIKAKLSGELDIEKDCEIFEQIKSDVSEDVTVSETGLSILFEKSIFFQNLIVVLG